MDINRKISAFAKLANKLNNIDLHILESVSKENSWFIPEFTKQAFSSLSKMINKQELTRFSSYYDLKNESLNSVGVIMAGNIPAVGFHDLLCVLLSGNVLYVKLSSKDTVSMEYIISKLIEIEPEFGKRIHIVGIEKLMECDTVIFTGSNNTAKIIEEKFKGKRMLVRSNKSSIAILSGDESKEELELLASDIFKFFGLGCRNISKLFVPNGYDFKKLVEACQTFKFMSETEGYMNNYLNQKAIFTIDNVKFIEGGFFLLTENNSVVSPLSIVNFSCYKSKLKVLSEIKISDNIQCVVGDDQIKFGSGQNPMIDDFADGIDVMEFLLKCSY